MWREYLFPTSVEETLEMLVAHEGEARIIAGGTDLVLQSQRGKCPSEVMVDISQVPGLDQIEERDGYIYIGALVTHSQVAASELIRAQAPLLAQASGTMGGPQIRNVATLVGNVVNALPAADGAVALFALDAELQVADPGGTSWHAIDAIYETVGVCTINSCVEMVTAIRFRPLPDNYRSAYQRIARRRAVALPIINVAAAVGVDNGTLTDVRVAVGPVAPKPFRVHCAEQSLIGHEPTPERIAAAAAMAAKDAKPRSSPVRGSRAYRTAMVEVLVRRALSQATKSPNEREE